MIKITSLNKIYQSKKRKKCHALRDINLTLDDTGLVFVLGKSGSGKSTLLNLIGALDNVTSGSIEVDGNDLAAFKERDFCNYRNTHIGFIFQDYHLIDELTVYENIVLSLNLKRIEDRKNVKAALEKVELAGYEDRYPSELSGGEQQRVAIARAIVKKPRVILADEPTGNLDTNTATAVITLLKELSKECLILIVSHNVNDANNYADRIIELKKGKIISDKSKNPDFANEVILKNETLVYPDGLALSDRDIDFMNENTGAKFVKRTDKFLPTEKTQLKGKQVKIENKSLGLGKKINLSGKFLKNKSLAISLSAFMVAVIMVIMALAQTIIAFDGSEIISAEMGKSNQDVLLLSKSLSDASKAKLDKIYPVAIPENDIQDFYHAGYKGKIYPVYSNGLAINSCSTLYGTGTNHFHSSIFMSEAFGTMVVDENFLFDQFGNLEFIAEAKTKPGYGIYITDYLADCTLTINDKYKGKTYDDLLGNFYIPNYSAPRMYVNGIIKTNYKEKYGDLIEKAKKGLLDTSTFNENQEIQSFLDEIYTKLGFCYSLNPNFTDDFLESSLSVFPAHYKINVNSLVDYYKSGPSYVAAYNFTSHDKLPNHLASGWCYLNEPPEIPDGAKYIRVSFNDAIDTYYQVVNDITTRESAILRFDDNEPISKELMNFHYGQNTGIHLNNLSGEIDNSPIGSTSTYISDYIEIPTGAKITEFLSIALSNSNYLNAFYVFYDENKVPITGEPVFASADIEADAVMMSVSMYNEIFGTEYDETNIHNFVPHSITLTQYDYDDINNEKPLFEPQEVMVIGLYTKHSYDMMVNDNLGELFKKDFVRSYYLYFDGTDGIGAVLDMAEELNFEPQSFAVEGIHTMTKAVDVFVPIFELIAILLCVGVIFILVNFSTKTIKDKMHEIGILKALGAKNATIGVVFGLQVILIAALTCILSTAGYYFFIDLANDVLIESLKRLAPSNIVLDLDFLTFKPKIALQNCALIFILTLASLIIPLLKIKAIKPVKIIKAKE